MLIQESFVDVPTKADGEGSMRMYCPPAKSCMQADEAGIYTFHPTIPGYPKARFPGVVVFSEIYQGTPIHLHTRQILTDMQSNRPRRPLRPPNRRTGLHLRSPINLPRIHRPRTPRL